MSTSKETVPGRDKFCFVINCVLSILCALTQIVYVYAYVFGHVCICV